MSFNYLFWRWYHRNRYALSRLAILASSVLLVGLGLRLCRFSTTGGISFLGAFLIVTGAQVGLSALGIRLELLNNTVAPEALAPRKAIIDSPSGPMSLEEEGIPGTYLTVMPFRECVVKALIAIEEAERSVAGRLVYTTKTDEANRLALRLIQQAQDNPAVAILVLSSEVERAAAHASVTRADGESWMSTQRIEKLNNAYEIFWVLRTSVLHDRSATLDARTAYEVIDIGERLLRLLGSLQPTREAATAPEAVSNNPA